MIGGWNKTRCRRIASRKQLAEKHEPLIAQRVKLINGYNMWRQVR
jgi:hypothetical protein